MPKNKQELKKSLVTKVRTELQKTGDFQEPDSSSGISGIPTTAFLSSALLTAIGFGIRDGFFHKCSSLPLGLLLFFLNFLLALVLIVSGIVIFQTIRDSKSGHRNLKIYWVLLILGVIGLILIP